MYLPLIQHMIRAEMRPDRLSKIQQQRLLDAIERDRRQNRTNRKVLRWLGTQMITWGTKLQRFQNTDTGCQETSLKVSTIAR